MYSVARGHDGYVATADRVCRCANRDTGLLAGLIDFGIF